MGATPDRIHCILCVHISYGFTEMWGLQVGRSVYPSLYSGDGGGGEARPGLTLM